MKQTKRPLTEDWFKKNMVQIYNGILFSHEKEGINATCSIMDGPRESY